MFPANLNTSNKEVVFLVPFVHVLSQKLAGRTVLNENWWTAGCGPGNKSVFDMDPYPGIP